MEKIKNNFNILKDIKKEGKTSPMSDFYNVADLSKIPTSKLKQSLKGLTHDEARHRIEGELLGRKSIEVEEDQVLLDSDNN